MKIKKIIGVALAVMCISTTFVGCGQQTVSEAEYEALLEKVPKFNETYLPQFKVELREFIQKLYSPGSKADIDEALSMMEQYMTVDELQEFRSITNPYDPNIERNNISNLIIRFGHKDNQSDSMHKFYITFNINEDSEYGIRVAIKFTVNPNGKIFKHNIKVENVSTNYGY